MAAAVMSTPSVAVGTGGPPTATASGLLAMLTEPSPPLRTAALRRLLTCVDVLWHEVAESLPDLEAIAEGGTPGETAEEGGEEAEVEVDEDTRRIAAAVASRVYFHLEEPVQSLRLALEAGPDYFDVDSAESRRSPYVECLVAAAIEAYVGRRRRMAEEAEGLSGGGAEEKKAEGEDGDEEADQLDMDKLSGIIHQMFERCYADGRYTHALGVAFEAREVGKVREVLDRCDSSPVTTVSDRSAVLRYALDAAVGLVTSRPFRDEVVGIVVDRLRAAFDSAGSASSAARNSSAVALCVGHQLLGRAQPVSDLIASLLDVPGDDSLLGLQLCFDIVDSGDQGFVSAVADGLPKEETGAAAATAAAVSASAAGEGEAVEVTTPTSSSSAPTGGTTTTTSRSPETWSRFTAALRVLTGGFASELALSFLHKNSDSDALIMEHLKKALEERGASRNSVLHNCAVATHAYLNAGTTNDSFLRDHLDWMKKASNWAKFSATASLGVLHAGHTTEAMTLLEPYLPPSASTTEGGAAPPPVTAAGGYAEGGSLYALGLIHGSHAGSSSAKRKETSDFLREHLRNSHANEVISHGAALGVGLTSFGTADLDVVNELKELLYTDSAVAGEAAGMAIGMVLVGSGVGSGGTPHGGTSTSGIAPSDAEELAEVVTELRNYARETQHEKIIRGIAVGMALINFGREEDADATIEEMRSDRDPILRYGAMYSLALAYCGTGSNKAIRILLHTAVSDVSDDVRMAAVIALAFVLFKTPERVPQLVKLLLESFNPHVRYASCMAVGIAMAGTGDSESVALLEPMLDDMADFVRQGALLGTAMIYMQQSDTCNGRKVKSFREKLTTTIGDKHQSTLTKMGAILSTGIIDAGGRNCSLDLGSRNGFTKMSSAVGLALWLQHWHWYPMMHMFSLALTPTFTIGLNGDFKYPKNFEIVCNSRPSVFAYPKRLEEKKEEKKKRVETVTLSTTAKNQARLARKKAKEAAEAGEDAEDMDVDKKEEETKEEEKKEKDAEEKKEGGESMDVDGGEGEGEEGGKKSPAGKKKREPEPTSFRISNPARITKAQAEVCEFDMNQRYRPVLPEERPCGVIILTDSTPGEEEDLGAVKAPSLEAEDEADPPEPFEWAPPGHPEAEVTSRATEETKTDGDDTGGGEAKEATAD